MLSLCRIDAAFKQLYEYDPDLDVGVLSLDESFMTDEERIEYALQARILRVTLVARIADIGVLCVLVCQLTSARLTLCVL